MGGKQQASSTDPPWARWAAALLCGLASARPVGQTTHFTSSPTFRVAGVVLPACRTIADRLASGHASPQEAGRPVLAGAGLSTLDPAASHNTDPPSPAPTMTKRRFSDCAEFSHCDVSVIPAGDQQAAAGERAVRCCRTAEPVARAWDPQQRAAAFLDALAHEAGGPSAASLPAPLRDPQLWQCWAQAHLVLEGAWATLPAAAMRSYHSFVKAPKAAMFSRFAAACGLRTSAAGALDDSAPAHVHMAAFLLQRLCGPYPEASMVRISLELPPFMAGWAAAWGRPPAQPLEVLLLHAFAPEAAGAGSHAGAPSARPARTFFVPAFDQCRPQ